MSANYPSTDVDARHEAVPRSSCRAYVARGRVTINHVPGLEILHACLDGSTGSTMTVRAASILALVLFYPLTPQLHAAMKTWRLSPAGYKEVWLLPLEQDPIRVQ